MNIETLQCSDFQFNSRNRIILNLWSAGDLIQWLGTIRDSDKFVLTPGPLGVRIDSKADQNIQFVSFPRLLSTDFGGAMYIWMKTFGGHSLQGYDWFKLQIYYHLKKKIIKVVHLFMRKISVNLTIYISIFYFSICSLLLLNKASGGADILFLGLLGICLGMHFFTYFTIFIIGYINKKFEVYNIFINLLIVLFLCILYILIDWQVYFDLF